MPAISLSNPYSQTFDTLASTGTGITWTDDSTLAGWYSNRALYNTGTGSSTTGSLYSFGSSSSSDRALGSVGSGSTGTILYGARFLNDTSSTINALNISYVGEQWRNGGGTGLAQTVDFQFQVNATSLSTGVWSDFNALDFTSPVFSTTASALDGNAAANRTALSATLDGLSLAPGQEIWLRWSDIDHPSNDHGLGIDDLTVTAITSQPIAGITLTESGGITQVNEATPEITDSYTIALNTTPTGTVQIAIAADTQTQISIDGVNFFSSVTLTLDSTTTQGAVTVRAVNDTVVEGPHTGIITHTITSSADPAYASLTIPDFNVSIIDNDVALQLTRIHQIQGNASTQLAGGAHNDVSPLNDQTVTIEGVVTADFQLSTQLRGFFIQEELADQDTDPTTSEGIFVFTGNTAPLDVQEGQIVRLTGAVSEFFGMTQVSATTAGSITLVNGGNNLALVPPTIIGLPVTGDINDFYEQYEGMRVQFADKLYVSEYFELARYGQIVLTAGGRPYQYSHIDNTPTSAEYAAFLDNLRRSRIILDDDNNRQNAPLPDGVFYHPQTGGFGTGTQGVNYFRGGDSVSNLTGVLHWSFAGQTGTDAWRIRPTEATPVTFTVENPRPTTAPDVGGNIKVANFNVLNYFDAPFGVSQNRGADSEDEFNRQNEKLIAALTGINADIFGLVEIENNGTAIQELVNRLNAVAGAGTYSYINTGVVGTDEITVAIIYKPAVVQPKGTVAILNDPAFTDPNSTGQQRNRPAIAQTFEVINPNNPDFGEAFTVVVNHLKSKRAAEATGADLDQNDGQSAWNDTRTKAAAYLVNTWLPGDPTGQGDPDYLIIGDLNAYRGETPITAIKNAGYTDLVERFGGNNAYSFVFDGQLGYLDHALANASMAAQVTGVAEWHINADEVPVFDYNNTLRDGDEQSFEAKPTGNNLYEPNAFRTSDHDPVIIGLDLIRPSLNVIEGTRGNDTINGTEGPDRINGNNGDDTIRGLGGDDVIEGGRGGDIIYGGGGNDILAADRTDRFDDFDGTISEIYGEGGNDTIYGGSKADLIDGGTGNDTLFGKGGDDRILGGDSNDLLNGGLGNDNLDGGSGIDTADYSDLVFNGVFGTIAGLDVNLISGIARHSSTNRALAWADTLSNIENVIGTSRNDRFIGDANNNVFDGGSQVGRSDRLTTFTALNGQTYTVTGDVVEYSGTRASFTLSGDRDRFTVTGSGIGTDTLINIEFIKFDDGLFSVASLFT
ncbi:MAG: ExeM/NucH family extracellular endonuclease [Leptolyngbyaceae cyanobacterium HOT.MB2.61]|nr:ExeM/NucH family extracellular endonuclease [Leptolyngbyaceae cyanobacterium HOT.MB2.61]